MRMFGVRVLGCEDVSCEDVRCGMLGVRVEDILEEH